MPTVVIATTALGTTVCTAFSPICVLRLVAPEIWNCEPPRNSIPNLKPSPKFPPPLINGTANAATTRRIAMPNQIRLLPTKSIDRLPV